MSCWAASVADSDAAIARDGAELVEIDYRPLAAVTECELRAARMIAAEAADH